jgi:gliding motility-associated-like protein
MLNISDMCDDGDATTTDDTVTADCECEGMIEKYGVYFPNVFTPNNDGINDEFKAYTQDEILSFELKIYDRWGGLLFSSNNLNEGWNGISNSKKLENGVYLYHCQINDKHIFSGDVTLIR